MKRILNILFILCCFHVQAQDTIYDNTKHVGDTLVLNYVFGCDHGHICCEAPCRCCPERNQEQRYDTIYAKPYQNVQRITVVERHFYARSHEFMPVHFRFRTGKGEWSKKYYWVNDPRHYGYRNNDRRLAQYPGEKEEVYQRDNRILVVDSAGDYSLIDLAGNQLPIPFQLNEDLGTGVFLSGVVICDQMIFGFSDGKGKKIGPLNIRSITPFGNDSITIVETAVGWRLVNRRGEYIGDTSYVQLDALGSGMYSVIDLFVVEDLRVESFPEIRVVYSVNDNRRRLINSKGENLSDVAYIKIRPFTEGFALAEKGKDSFALLDMKGREVLQLNYQEAGEYHDGLIAVYNGQHWGYVDTTGQVLIDFKYKAANPFVDGHAVVKLVDKNEESGEWQLINKKDRCLKHFTYSSVEEFKNGYAKACVPGKGCTLINTSGNELFPPEYVFGDYNLPNSWFLNNRLIITKSDYSSSTKMINELGEDVMHFPAYRGVNFAYEMITSDYSNSSTKPLPYYVVIHQNNAKNIADSTGMALLTPENYYDQVYLYSESRAIAFKHAYSEKTITLFDLPSGKIVKKFEKRELSQRIEGVIAIRENPYERTEYYDLDGNRLPSLE